jgi:deoxycytidylate deaminase
MMLFGYNSHRRFFGGYMNHSLHAEMTIVLQIIKRLKIWDMRYILKSPLKKINGVLYIARSNGCRLSNCKPCSDCDKYLLACGITTIKYTDFIDGQEVLITMRRK